MPRLMPSSVSLYSARKMSHEHSATAVLCKKQTVSLRKRQTGILRAAPLRFSVSTSDRGDFYNMEAAGLSGQSDRELLISSGISCSQ